METLILILFATAVLLSGIQLSFVGNKWAVAAWLLVFGIFVFAVHTRAIEQSYDSFTRQLENTRLITDFVVVLVLEALLGILTAIFMIRKHFGESARSRFRLAMYFPGLTVFPALFYFMSLFYLNSFTFSFTSVAVALAVAFPLVILLLRYTAKKIVPEFELRAELKFILHILQLLGGIILSIQYMKLPVAQLSDAPVLPLGDLLIMLLLTAGFVGIGLLKHRLLLWIRKQTLTKS